MIKPTAEMVQAYSLLIGYTLDGQRFIDYYESCGWMVGKNKRMVDWKAAVRTWKRLSEDKPKEPLKPKGLPKYVEDRPKEEEILTGEDFKRMREEIRNPKRTVVEPVSEEWELADIVGDLEDDFSGRV